MALQKTDARRSKRPGAGAGRLALQSHRLTASGDRFALVGTIVADKYAIERVVGEGGFGIVFQATHRIWDEPVALKCFTALSNAPVELRDELLDQFVQEGKLLSKLSSRTTGIVQARDIGTLTTPGGAWLPYMVLEWLDGKTLESFLGHEGGVAKGQRHTVLETFSIMDGAVRALALAHALGVAHRDIKPANFFVLGGELVPGQVIKVLDFGIAKVMQQTQGATQNATGMQISSFTPNYGAPEQFDRTYGATGPWTDVFQMALVLVEIIRGGAPTLGGEQFMQLAFSSQNPDRRPTPRLFGVEVGDEVEAVFKKAVALKVVDRYQNMAEFWMALAYALGIRDYAALPTADSLLLTTGLGTTSGGIAQSRAVSALVATPVTQPPTKGPVTQAPQKAPTIVNSSGPKVKRPGAGKAIAIGVVAALAVGGVAFALTREGPPPPPEPVKPEPVVAPPPETKVPTPPPTPCPEGMALIEGGRFFMGTDMVKPVLAAANPAHKVEVARFCIDLNEVTTAQYEACSKAGDCKRAFKESFWPQGSMKKPDWEKARAAYSALCNAETDRAQHPINCVMWSQADEYCKVQGKRLPSEAEFEFAARGSDGRVFPWGDATPDQNHLNGCGSECVAWRKAAGLPPVSPLYAADDKFPGTSPVGSFPAGKTQAGLLDVVGNVFEWTADEYKPYPRPDATDPAMPPNNNRVIRGGAFNSFEVEHADPALRLPYDADAHTHGIGFRCAMNPRS